MEKLVNLRNVIRGISSPPPCDRAIDIRLLHAKNGSSKCLWKINESLLNGNGVTMGGFTASAADIAMSYAITTLLKENSAFASINLETTFHRPITAGEAVVTATVKRIGTKTAYLQATVTQNDKRAADAVSTVMIFPNEE